jgi:hypothetical protein
MKLNNCLCPGQEDQHPGPNLTVGRSAPEIDAVEAQVRVRDAKGVYDPSITVLNTYWGSTYQQAVSYLTDVESQYYVDNSPEYGVFGFEYMGESSWLVRE